MEMFFRRARAWGKAGFELGIILSSWFLRLVDLFLDVLPRNGLGLHTSMGCMGWIKQFPDPTGCISSPLLPWKGQSG